MEKKDVYLLIECHGEKNMGVINAGWINPVWDKEKIRIAVVEYVEPALVKALEEHFDCEIKVINHELVESSPFEIIFYVIVKGLEEDRQEKIYLNQTWVFSK